MKIHTLMGLGVALCAAAVLSPPRTDLRADDVTPVKLVGDPKVDNDLMKKNIEELQKALSQGAPSKADIKRAKVLALVIGLNSQAIGEKGQAAAIYEQAGKVITGLTKEGGLDDAKAAVKALTTAKVPSGDKPVDLVKAALFDTDPTVNDWDRDLAMQLFKASTTRIGGMGIEKKIKDWTEKAPVGKDLDLVLPNAQKVAIIAAALQQVPPPAGKPANDWMKYAKEMQQSAEEAIKLATAPKKDGKAIMAAMNKLDASCTKCHDKYKP